MNFDIDSYRSFETHHQKIATRLGHAVEALSGSFDRFFLEEASIYQFG